MPKQKPDAILIGYQKAGTTYLRSYFSNHPSIEWTRTHDYFGMDNNYGKGNYFDPGAKRDAGKCYIDMYENLTNGFIWKSPPFPDVKHPDSEITGHKFYIDPIEIAERIHKTVPNARIIITLRSQVEWVRSNYVYFIRGLPRDRKKFRDFASTYMGKGVLMGGMYHVIIEEYYRLFGKENVHVMLLEQIENEREDAFRGLCKFLGIGYFPPPHEKMNQHKGIGKAGGNLIRILSSAGLSDDAIKKITPVFRPLKSVLYRFMNYDPLSKNERSLIASLYSVSNYRTARITGIDLKKYGYPF